MYIFVCGFMGSGKTSLLKWLIEKETQKVNAPYQEKFVGLDLDEEILKRIRNEGISDFQELVVKRGWDYFRLIEKETLDCVMRYLQDNKPANALIALGGGSLSQENLKLIKKHPLTQLVWLDIPFEVCFSRIQKEGGHKRPMLEKGEEYLRKLFEERRSLYSQCHVRLGGDEIGRIQGLFDLVSGPARGHNGRKSSN